MEIRLFTLFFRLAQAEKWTKSKGFCCSCNQYFLSLMLVVNYVGLWEQKSQDTG